MIQPQVLECRALSGRHFKVRAWREDGCALTAGDITWIQHKLRYRADDPLGAALRGATDGWLPREVVRHAVTEAINRAAENKLPGMSEQPYHLARHLFTDEWRHYRAYEIPLSFLQRYRS